jgi:transcriptional regulator with XRE-family HTH domain
MFDPERIRQARKEAGLTQGELAARLGKHRDTIRFYENGRTEPPGRVVEQIAALTGKGLRWFIRDEGPPQTLQAGREPSASVTGYDPDEPPVPFGLQRLIDIGLPLRRDELARLLGYADPLSPTRGARGAARWTPGEWLDALLEERRMGAP